MEMFLETLEDVGSGGSTCKLGLCSKTFLPDRHRGLILEFEREYMVIWDVPYYTHMLLVLANFHHHLTLPWHSCLEPRSGAEILPEGFHLISDV